MPDALPARFVIAFVIVLALIALSAWLFRRFSGHAGIQPWGKGHDHRIEILDAMAVDPRRRLLLVRCDEDEHLLLVGGGTDVVISRHSNIAHVAEPHLQRSERHQQQLRAQEAEQRRTMETERQPAPRDPRLEPQQPFPQHYAPGSNGRMAAAAEAHPAERRQQPPYAPQQHEGGYAQTPQAARAPQAPQPEQRSLQRQQQPPRPLRAEDLVPQQAAVSYAQPPREPVQQASPAPEAVPQASAQPRRQPVQPEPQLAPRAAPELPKSAGEQFSHDQDVDLTAALARSLEETMPSSQHDNVEPLQPQAPQTPPPAAAQKAPPPAPAPAPVQPKAQASAPPPPPAPQPEPEAGPAPEPRPEAKNPVYDDMAKRLEAALKPLDTTYDSAGTDKKAKN